MPFVEVEGKKLKTKKEIRYIGVTFYFTRIGYTEPESDDIFEELIPEGIINRYNLKEKSLWVLLDFIQKRPSPDDNSGLTDKLNDEVWVKNLSNVKIHICDLDEPVNQDIKDKLIGDIKQLQYDELDEMLDQFFSDHGMDEFDSTEKTKYLQTYLNARI